jgi:hypothetical protein
MPDIAPVESLNYESILKVIFILRSHLSGILLKCSVFKLISAHFAFLVFNKFIGMIFSPFLRFDRELI